MNRSLFQLSSSHYQSKNLGSAPFPLSPCRVIAGQLHICPHFQSEESDYVLTPSSSTYRIWHSCQGNHTFHHPKVPGHLIGTSSLEISTYGYKTFCTSTLIDALKYLFCHIKFVDSRAYKRCWYVWKEVFSIEAIFMNLSNVLILAKLLPVKIMAEQEKDWCWRSYCHFYLYGNPMIPSLTHGHSHNTQPLSNNSQMYCSKRLLVIHSQLLGIFYLLNDGVSQLNKWRIYNL